MKIIIFVDQSIETNSSKKTRFSQKYFRNSILDIYFCPFLKNQKKSWKTLFLDGIFLSPNFLSFNDTYIFYLFSLDYKSNYYTYYFYSWILIIMASNHFKLRKLQRELIINQNKAEVLLLMELLWAVGAGTVLHAWGIVVNSLDTTLLLGIHPFPSNAIL